MRRKLYKPSGDISPSADSTVSVRTPKSKRSRLPPILRSVLSFNKKKPAPLSTNEETHSSLVGKGATYAVPFLEAVNMVADACPPLKSVSGGALWISKTLKEYKASGEDDKAFAEYLEHRVACAIASEVKNGDPMTLETHVEQLNDVLHGIRKDIVHWQSQSHRKRFARFIKVREPVQEYKERLDRALVVFNLGATLLSREEQSRILSDTESIIATLQDIVRDVCSLKRDIAQTKIIATNVQDTVDHLDKRVEKMVVDFRDQLDDLRTYALSFALFGVFLG